VIGADDCPTCEKRTGFALVGRRARPEELVGTDFEGLPNAGIITWQCLICGTADVESSLERLLVHLAALGLDPQPTTPAA
jgi:hypothetical protein